MVAVVVVVVSTLLHTGNQCELRPSFRLESRSYFWLYVVIFLEDRVAIFATLSTIVTPRSCLF